MAINNILIPRTWRTTWGRQERWPTPTAMTTGQPPTSNPILSKVQTPSVSKLFPYFPFKSQNPLLLQERGRSCGICEQERHGVCTGQAWRSWTGWKKVAWIILMINQQRQKNVKWSMPLTSLMELNWVDEGGLNDPHEWSEKTRECDQD